MSTHSPGVGMSSCSKPRSTLRRTPTTSMSAVFLWSDPSQKISTICPGIARHMPSHFLPSQDVEREFQLVFHFQRTSSDGSEFQIMVRLSQRKVTKNTERIRGQRDSRRYRLRAGHAVHAQIAIECNRILALTGLRGGDARTLINDLRVG